MSINKCMRVEMCMHERVPGSVATGMAFVFGYAYTSTCMFVPKNVYVCLCVCLGIFSITVLG